MKSLAERFWPKVDTSGGPDACWPWTASLNNVGYGQINEGGRGRPLLAHRVAWELAAGPIPDGLHVDHLCRNRPCVNPTHLEPVTQALNNVRAVQGPTADGSVCKYSHAYDEANTRIRPNGTRACRACARDRYHARKAA